MPSLPPWWWLEWGRGSTFRAMSWRGRPWDGLSATTCMAGGTTATSTRNGPSRKKYSTMSTSAPKSTSDPEARFIGRRAGTAGRGNDRVTTPSTVLALSPYPWDCVGLQLRCNIVLRPGAQTLTDTAFWIALIRRTGPRHFFKGGGWIGGERGPQHSVHFVPWPTPPRFPGLHSTRDVHAAHALSAAIMRDGIGSSRNSR